MNGRFGTFILYVALACSCLASFALAQDNSEVRPRFEALPPHAYYTLPPSGSKLTQWKGSFTDLTGVKRTFTMVGTDPHKTNVTTTTPVFLIPIKMVYGASNGNKTFNPNTTKAFGGMTTTQMVLSSPILNSNVDFVQGGTDLGKTQYIDAFQRGNFWSVVKKNNKYHVLLGKPKVLPMQTLNVTASEGTVITNPFLPGHVVGTFDFGQFDVVLQGYIHKFTQIHPNSLPIFVTYDIYLTSGGCCIGGYHSTFGPPPNSQTYSYTTIIDQGSGVFSQDTAAMSHEIGEWTDNPFFGANTVGCQDNSQLEVGDPLVLDDHPYTVKGFTYHLQDLVWLGYFGAPPKTSLLKWLSFQNDEKNVCPGQ